MTNGVARLSIREISRRTDIPESTLRYYRKLFPEFIPTMGSGRRRRHPESAIAVYERISRLFDQGNSRETVRRRLAGAQSDSETSNFISVSGARNNAGIERTLRSADAALRARPGGQVEQLLSAMMVRDRELATMHRELLDLVGRLLKSLEGVLTERRKPATDQLDEAAPSDGAEDREREETVGTGGDWSESAESSGHPREDQPGARELQETRRALRERVAEVEELRETLSREQETVERLRRARLELEQRLARVTRGRESRQ